MTVTHDSYYFNVPVTVLEYGTSSNVISWTKDQNGDDGRGNWCNRYLLKVSRSQQGCRGRKIYYDNGHGLGWWPQPGLQLVSCPAPSLDYVVTELDELRLLNKLAERCKGDAFNPALAFAELDKTAKMLGDDIHILANAIRLVKKGDPLRALKLLATKENVGGPLLTKKNGKPVKVYPPDKMISNHYLEWTYGWKPLINDIKDGAEAYANATLRKKKRAYAVTMFHEEASPGSVVRWDGRAWTEWVEYFDNPLSLDNVLHGNWDMKTWQAMALSGAQVAWERTYLSFVADWVLNVGETLQAAQSILVTGGRVGRSNKYLSKSWSEPTSGYVNGVGSYPFVDEDFGQTFNENFTFSRYAKEWSIFGLMTDYLLSLNKKFSPTHIANGLALLSSIHKGNKKKLSLY